MLNKNADPWEKMGMCLHIMINSINKNFSREEADHVVFCLEGESWRKTIYPQYKAGRRLARQELTEAEQEENKLIYEAYEDFCQFLTTQTNCTVLQNPIAEADDLIARWVALHPQDLHTIISSDSDFHQLLAPNVEIYNGITDQRMNLEGWWNDRDQPVLEKKTGEPKEAIDPEYALFMKCIRGEKGKESDNIDSAYPGVREKNTKKKKGIRAAFEDRNIKGLDWNNFMQERWAGKDGKDRIVAEEYQRNVLLIDLTAQPDDVKEYIDSTIKEAQGPKNVGMTKIKFMQFCGKYELTKAAEHADYYTKWLSANYEDNEC